MPHLLVTNDFPPKVGGIQTYLWDLWRRLPPEEVTVLTTNHEGAAEFDRTLPFRIERTGRALLPTPTLLRRINTLAESVHADVVFIDPALPLGILGPGIERPYCVIVHGAEVVVPARLPLFGSALRRVLRHSVHVIAGSYPATEMRRLLGEQCPPITVISPGVDVERFHPMAPASLLAARARFGLAKDRVVVLGVSRLVPRKGFDVVIESMGSLADEYQLQLVIAGAGRDRSRLERLARQHRINVKFLGSVEEEDLASIYGCADIFVMMCRARWNGLEQEGFGIVFLEAAACGVPQVAGASGGSAEAVVHGVTGMVVSNPTDRVEVGAAIGKLASDPQMREVQGKAARVRATSEFDNDRLAGLLSDLLIDLRQ